MVRAEEFAASFTSGRHNATLLDSVGLENPHRDQSVLAVRLIDLRDLGRQVVVEVIWEFSVVGTSKTDFYH